jgi:hypothetical protein
MGSTSLADLTPAAALEELVLDRLGNRVRNFRILRHGDGLILQGRTSTFHHKQLAQHAVMESAGELPIVANEIEVS